MSRYKPIYHIRLVITDIKSYSTYTQLSKVELYRHIDYFHDVPISWDGTTVTCNKQAVKSGEGASNLIDGSVDTKACFDSGVPSSENPVIITFSNQEGFDLTPNEYDDGDWGVYKRPVHWRWYTADDSPERDPVTYKLQISYNGTKWETVDDIDRDHWTVTNDRKTEAYSGDIRLYPRHKPIDLTDLSYIKQYIDANDLALDINTQTITTEYMLYDLDTYTENGVSVYYVNIPNYTICGHSAVGIIIAIDIHYKIFIHSSSGCICVNRDNGSSWYELAFKSAIPTKISQLNNNRHFVNGIWIGEDFYDPFEDPDSPQEDAMSVSLPEYPTSLPASDVYEWAKASTKPSYNASEVGAIASTTKGSANGVAELDSSGKVPSSQLPTLDGAQTVSGNPITVTDAEAMNAESVVVELEPKQDLHGYDKPWVGGSGKNKLDNTSWTTQTINGVTFTPQTDGTILVNGVNDGTADSIYWLIDYSAQITPQEEQILSGLPSEYSGVVWGGNNIGSSNTDVALHQGTSYSIALLVGNSERVDNVTIYPMIRLSTESDATFTPYSNICPISGYSEVNVEVSGDNLVESTLPYTTIEANGTINTSTGSPTYDMHIAKITQGETYTIQSDQSEDVNQKFVGGFFYDMPQLNSVSYNNARLADAPATFTAPIDGYVAFRTNHDYAFAQLYQGNTHTIDLDGTKYGGTLDVTDGGYSDEWGYISGSSVSDLVSASATTGTIGTTGGGLFYISFGDIGTPTSSDATPTRNVLQCNELDNEPANYIWEKNTSGITSDISGYIFFVVKDITTQADMDTWLSNNPIQIAYRKKTPSSASTTPTDIPLLENTNNISTNATNIQLKYQPNNVIGECKAYTDEQIEKHNPLNYSTDEKAVGTWIDGKTIWQKTIEFDSPIQISNDYGNDITTYFTDIYDSIGTFVSAFSAGGNGNSCLPLYVQKFNNKVEIWRTINIAVNIVNITIQYTKI